MVRPKNTIIKTIVQSARNISEKPVVKAVSAVSKTAPENRAIAATINGSFDTSSFLPIKRLQPPLLLLRHSAQRQASRLPQRT